MRVLTFFKHLLKPSKKKIILLIILLVVLFGGYQYVQSQSSKKEEIKTTTVKRETIKETVSASGSLTGKDTADMHFKISGKLADSKVKIGDTVQKGQILASLDTTQLAISLQQARNNLLSKQATAERVEDELKDKKETETHTEKEERKAAQSARDSAFDSVKEAQRALSDAVLYAPIEGIVTNNVPVIGQNISAADTIVQITDDSEKYFEAEVDEADIGKVSLGQKVEVLLNSYPDKTLIGIVEQILPNTKLTTSGATVIITRVKLEDQSIHFISNINGQSTITTKEVQNALVIPSESIVDDKYVYVKNGETYDKTEIKTGISADTGVEVTEGLNENQEITTTPSLISK